MVLNPAHRRRLFLIVTLFTISIVGLGQSKQQKTDGDSPSSLQGMTEAVLVNNQPALRILSRKNGATEILYQKRDGEDALVFSVMHWHALAWAQAPGETGKLYLTKTRLVYDPLGNKDHYFNVARTEVKIAEAQKSGRFGKNIGHHILIDAQGDAKRFAIVFNNNLVAGFQGDYMRPAIEFFERAIVEFDSALAEFQQLTARVRPEPEDDEEEKAEEEAADITDKYDRFKDVTTVRTTRMSLRGDKRSIRIQAEFSFAGKTPIRPGKVLLYLHSSAANPVFREDDLTLNFLIDGERVPSGNMRISNEEKTKSTTRQSLVIAIPHEAFARIANAKKAEFQIGTLEFKLTGTHIEAFKKLLARAIQQIEIEELLK